MSIRIFQGLGIIALLLFLLYKPIIFTSSVAKEPLPYNAKIAANTKRILGIDVSHQQGDINWQKVAQAGVSFAYLKASDGVTYQDPAFVTYANSITQTSLLVGAYHFFEAEDDPIAQAKNFINQVKSVDMSLLPMVDVEITKNQTPHVIASRLHAYLQYVNASLGCKPIIYSSRNFWSKNIGATFAAYPVWLAEYNATLTPPKGIDNVVLWQYSDKGKIAGINHEVDLDRVLSAQQGLESLKCKY
ncbi:lysozyme [Pseudoalteromonas citrea]|uniref:Lysozyme n=2 Tax=Pseudoalteromonas citrea TaxID=43655 RepID=A0AAD4FQA0_9GAMM|nr:GH25 family lysozyme [Pseudoalteromonas citrea]KAF7764925.1 lysozyme [Pseudoalteromonas citrea]